MSCIVENGSGSGSGRGLCPSALRFAGNDDLPCPCCDTLLSAPLHSREASRRAKCYVSVLSLNDHQILQVPRDTCSVQENVSGRVWSAHTKPVSCDGEAVQQYVRTRCNSSGAADPHLTRISEPPDDTPHSLHFTRAKYQSEDYLDLDLLELLTDLKLTEPLDDRDSELEDAIMCGCQTPGLCDAEDDGDLGSDDYEEQEQEMEQEKELKNSLHEDTWSAECASNNDIHSTSSSSRLLHRKRHMFYVGDNDEIINLHDGIDFENCSSIENVELTVDSVSQQNKRDSVTTGCCIVGPPKCILRRSSRSSVGFPLKSALAPLLLPLQPILTILPPAIVSEIEELGKLYPGISEDYLKTLCEFGLLEKVAFSEFSSAFSTLSRARGISLSGSYIGRKTAQSYSDAAEDKLSESSVQADVLYQPEYRPTPSVRGLFLTASLVSMATTQVSGTRERKKNIMLLSSRNSEVRIVL